MLFLFTSRQYRKWASWPIETNGKKANVESGRDIAIFRPLGSHYHNFEDDRRSGRS